MYLYICFRVLGNYFVTRVKNDINQNNLSLRVISVFKNNTVNDSTTSYTNKVKKLKHVFQCIT